MNWYDLIWCKRTRHTNWMSSLYERCLYNGVQNTIKRNAVIIENGHKPLYVFPDISRVSPEKCELQHYVCWYTSMLVSSFRCKTSVDFQIRSLNVKCCTILHFKICFLFGSEFAVLYEKAESTMKRDFVKCSQILQTEKAHSVKTFHYYHPHVF